MLHYASSGLPNVWLKNGYTAYSTEYGEGVAIHDIEGLHAAIGMDIVRNRTQLTAAEFRFLRKELDMPQTQLAQALGVSESSLRGWENDRAKISAPADRVLRVLYLCHVRGEGCIADLIQRLSQLNRDAFREERLEMEETECGWKTAA